MGLVVWVGGGLFSSPSRVSSLSLPTWCCDDASLFFFGLAVVCFQGVVRFPPGLSISLLSVLSLGISLYLPLCWLPFLSRPLLSPCLPNRPLSISPSCCSLSFLVFLSLLVFSQSLALSRPCSPTCLSVPLVLPLNILFQVQTLARTRSCSLPHSRRSQRSAPSRLTLSPCLLTSFSLLVFFFPFSRPLFLSPSAPLPCLFSSSLPSLFLSPCQSPLSSSLSLLPFLSLPLLSPFLSLPLLSRVEYALVLSLL